VARFSPLLRGDHILDILIALTKMCEELEPSLNDVLSLSSKTCAIPIEKLTKMLSFSHAQHLLASVAQHFLEERLASEDADSDEEDRMGALSQALGSMSSAIKEGTIQDSNQLFETGKDLVPSRVPAQGRRSSFLTL